MLFPRGNLTFQLKQIHSEFTNKAMRKLILKTKYFAAIPCSLLFLLLSNLYFRLDQTVLNRRAQKQTFSVNHKNDSHLIRIRKEPRPPNDKTVTSHKKLHNKKQQHNNKKPKFLLQTLPLSVHMSIQGSHISVSSHWSINYRHIANAMLNVA